MGAQEVFQCRRCEKFGLSFSRHYKPSEYAEGNPENDIWIVGINPQGDPSKQDKRTKDQLRDYFKEESIHPYFKDFSKVSEKLYARMMSPEKGVCHTDAFKCYSNGLNEEIGRNADEIITNCSEYLSIQINRNSCDIRIVVCNGALVVGAVRNALKTCGFDPVVPDHFTYAEYVQEDKRLFVINSGFIGRIDNFAKRRLGYEIEQIAKQPMSQGGTPR